jgi:hypothetical protein
MVLVVLTTTVTVFAADKGGQENESTFSDVSAQSGYAFVLENR